MVRSLFKLSSIGYKIETKFEVDERFQTRFIAKKMHQKENYAVLSLRPIFFTLDENTDLPKLASWAHLL